jgi:ketosteroid isomerase-like protein
MTPWWLASGAFTLERRPVQRKGEVLMPDDASAVGQSAALLTRVRAALESGDLDAIGDLLVPGARWGAPDGPGDADCHNRDQVIAWWARAWAAGARAVVTEIIAGTGTLLVGLEVSGTPAAADAGGVAERWQVLTVRGDRIADIRGFDDRAAAAARAGIPA